MMSVGPAGRWGRHGLCPHPRGRRLAAPRGVACGCGAGIGQGSLFPGAGLASARRASCPSSPGHEGCLGPIGVRMVGGGFRVCQRGDPHRVVTLEASRRVMACLLPWGPRDLLGPWSLVFRGAFLGARGPRDGPDVVPSHGSADAEGRALVPQPV